MTTKFHAFPAAPTISIPKIAKAMEHQLDPSTFDDATRVQNETKRRRCGIRVSLKRIAHLVTEVSDKMR
ncbi:MAG: hypothetical protein VXY07_16825 [Planctomycetota bacterium]|nr:hypothetical protein [Planctomycetota bacterium]